MSGILVVVAHPDDEVLGCGGSISGWVRSGIQVDLVVLTDGESSRFAHPECEEAVDAICKRQAQCLSAGAELGIHSVRFAPFLDQRLEMVPRQEITKRIETEIALLRPDTVVTHSLADLNLDHRITAECAMTAARAMPGSPVLEVLSFFTPSSTEWAFGSFGPFRPNLFVELGEAAIESKLAAIECYADELRDFPHPRSIDALRVHAATVGSVVGVEYAEPFESVRRVEKLSESY